MPTLRSLGSFARSSEGSTLRNTPGKKNATIYFSQTHISDLKEVIQVDASIDEDISNVEEEDESAPLMGIV